MNTHAGLTLTPPTGTTFSYINARYKLAFGGGLSRVPKTI